MSRNKSKAAKSADSKNQGNFITRWFNTKVRNVVEEIKNEHESNQVDIIGRVRDLDDRLESENRITFTVHVATGGLIVESSRYDTKTDRFGRGLYIIDSDKDFGNEISKIITLENLK